MRVIDFHTHPHLTPEQHFAFYPNVVPATSIDMKQQLTEMGVAHICGSVLRKDGSFDMRELNDAALRLRDGLGDDFYTPGFHIHPAQVDESIREVERMYNEGVCLIGELVPYMHGWSNYNEKSYIDELNTILDTAQRYGMVCSYHTIWDWPIEPVIAAHPNMAFVEAHPRERAEVERHIERMRKYDNVFVDLSGTGILRFGCVRYLVDMIGSERIVFGTDYPICNPAVYIHAVRNEGLSEREIHNILYKNAAKILHL